VIIKQRKKGHIQTISVPVVKYSSHGQRCLDNLILFLSLSPNQQSNKWPSYSHINPFAIQEQCGKRISL